MKSGRLLPVMFLLATASVHGQTTWYVPDDYPTIEYAVSSSFVTDGDTVIVRPGTYVESISFLGKSITLKSEKGPSVTIMDAMNTDWNLIRFENDETADSVLEGFTLRNGLGKLVGPDDYRGGGVYIDGASPTIRNCILHNNMARYGGGIYVHHASPEVAGCTFIENIGFDYGGAICNEGSSSAVVTNCIFYDNSSGDYGGAVSNCLSSPTVTHCTFYNNSSGDYGSAMYNNDSSPIVANCIFWQNDAFEQIENHGSSSPEVTYSNVMGGYPGEGNIDKKPGFIHKVGRDLHISYDSPCRDAGDPSAPCLPDLDFEGDPRISHGKPDMGADEFHTHLYWTGDATPGGSVQCKFVGFPGTVPVGLFVGSGVLKDPIPTIWGDFHLQAPWSLIGPLGSIPSNGVLVLPASIPVSPPAPYSVPTQAMIGIELSNLYVLEVK